MGLVRLGMVWVLTLIPPVRAEVVGYYRFPTIHREQVVFAAEGDLWRVATSGGLAMRLTTHDGQEAFPKFSPDGRWIAFSGEYQGNVDVFVMPADGGQPRRLTYHPGRDEVVAWRPDSASVVFRTRRVSPNRDYRLFEVPVDGGHPVQVAIGVASLAAFSADGTHVAFNRFSREFRTWKRYQGGTAQDIWVGHLEDNTFSRITDWMGTDRFPMWHDQRVYFLSDRTGRLNLFTSAADGSDVRQLTDHAELDARWPDMSDGRIVYMYAGDLWLLDVESGLKQRIDIQLPTDRIRRQPRFEDAARTLERYGLSPDGRRIVLASRGEIWVRPTKPGRTIQLTHSSGIRQREPVFSPDGTQIACITDETGEQELAIYDAGGKEPRRILTHRERGWLFPPVWSPDGTTLAYSDLTMNLFLVDVETGELTRVDGSPNWEITEYTFSPDGQWLAYTMVEANELTSIFLYRLADQQIHRVTTEFSSDHSPVWDPAGRYLFFLSNRTFNPILADMDFQHLVTQTAKPYAVILNKDGKSPFLPDELLDQDQKDGAKDADTTDDKDSSDAADPKDSADDDESDPLPEVHIDLEGLTQRVVEFPVPADNYSHLHAIKGKLFYVSTPTLGLMDTGIFEPNSEPRGTLHVYDLAKKKVDVFVESLRDYSISSDGKRIAYRVGDEILVADSESPPGDEIEERVNPSDLSLAVRPTEEWGQIFAEAHRLQRDFYWDPNLGDLDWESLGERYARLLPRIGTRHELNDLIGQLIGELGTSHTYVWGGDLLNADPVNVGLLGADLTPDANAGAYRFARVLQPEVWETDVKAPLRMPHAGVMQDEYLFAINGIDLTLGDNVHAALANLAGEQVQLTVGVNPDRSDARDIQIETLTSDRRLRYRDWCRRNREYVDRESQGRIGYFHLPDMMGAGLVEFIKGFYPQVKKDGLIIDVRYNGGGFVSQMIIERLSRTIVAYDRPRRGMTFTYPSRVHVGRKVVLVNQHSGSDGDIFPAAFQLRRLGPVIGMRTWGGVVGIRGDKRFMDGGLSTQPEFAWWDRDREWGLENRGVDPDIEMDILPADYVAGRDPQLDLGISQLQHIFEVRPQRHPQPPQSSGGVEADRP